MLSAQHPTLDRLAKDLLKRQRLTECCMEQFLAGTTPNSSSSQSKNIEKLKHLVERYGSVSTMEFLKCVAYNFSL